MTDNIEFAFINKTDCDAVLPLLYDIIYGNMSVIAPTGNSYDDDKRTWTHCIKQALEAPERKLLVIYADRTIAGFFMYRVGNDTFYMEEIQFKPDFKGMGLFQMLYRYLITVIPRDTVYTEAYASKKNHKSQAILSHLGLENIGENKNGLSYHYKGLYAALYKHFTDEKHNGGINIRDNSLCFCGHDCSRCITYLATVYNDDALRLKSQAFYRDFMKRDVPLAEIKCHGGRSGDKFKLCGGCPFIRCCGEKEITSCAECDSKCDIYTEYREKYVNKYNQVQV